MGEDALRITSRLSRGTMLRETARYEKLCRHILYSKEFMRMFDYVQLPTFEIASDAAASFREILTRHKALAAEYLESNFDSFFTAFNAMLEKGNYVTRRQSLKLLSELLLDRANIASMMRYIGSVENLCLMMNLLRDEARSIQFEAFHVFKVFVANPNKPAPVRSILSMNREKMIGYLANFQNDREDEQFTREGDADASIGADGEAEAGGKSESTRRAGKSESTGGGRGKVSRRGATRRENVVVVPADAYSIVPKASEWNHRGRRRATRPSPPDAARRWRLSARVELEGWPTPASPPSRRATRTRDSIARERSTPRVRGWALAPLRRWCLRPDRSDTRRDAARSLGFCTRSRRLRARGGTRRTRRGRSVGTSGRRERRPRRGPRRRVGPARAR